jgi:hypothetical protein
MEVNMAIPAFTLKNKARPHIAILAFATLISTAASAADIWGSVNLASIHAATDQHYNQRNWGAGIELHTSPSTLAMAGAYRNSVNRESAYALAGWTPLDLAGAKIGAVAGLVTGYPAINNGHIAPAIAGLIRIEGERIGLNLILIPPLPQKSPLTLGLQAKFKF